MFEANAGNMTWLRGCLVEYALNSSLDTRTSTVASKRSDMAFPCCRSSEAWDRYLLTVSSDARSNADSYVNHVCEVKGLERGISV